MTTQSETKRATSKAAKPRQPEFDRELANKCEQLIGWRVASMQFPGGQSRDTIKLILKKSAPVYASRRSRKNKADTERLILQTISRAGGKVPKLLGSDGDKLLIQEDIPGVRLTQAIHNRSSKTISRYLDNALAGLAAIQQMGSEQGLDEKLSPLGDSPDWLAGLLDRPRVLGKFFDIPTPRLAQEPLKALLAMRNPRFVKWDSRPGNAIARDDGEVFWIDWEHSGTRNRLDDMVWLLADEFIPDRPDIEAGLLEKYLPVFADDFTIDQARQYFYVLGVFHLVVRLGLILKYKKDGSWWSYTKCLAGDKAGVTLRNVNRIFDRGVRWAEQNPETAELAPWFSKLRINLE
jgi:aminoglycoside phosphotransferase (APT) family kinase protein